MFLKKVVYIRQSNVPVKHCFSTAFMVYYNKGGFLYIKLNIKWRNWL